MSLYDGNGKRLSVQSQPFGGFLMPFWDSPNYDGVTGDPTATEIITQMFDPLMEGNGDYISKTVIGRDASDTYDMYEYVFTPPTYTQTIWIQSGVHSREKAAVFGLARFLNELVNNWKSHDGLNYIRWNVRLVVIPIVNPWGLSQTNPGTDTNSNGVNLNRDNFSESKQAETVNVQTRFAMYKDALSFAIDSHSTVVGSYGDYAIHWATAGAEISHMSKAVIDYLCHKNIAGEPDLHYMGVSGHSGVYCKYFHENGVPGVTLEHADYVWDKSNKYAAVCIQRSAELITNAVIQYVSARYKVVDAVSKYYTQEITATG